MMAKLRAFFDLFRKGEIVANPSTWQNRVVAAGALTALMVSLKDLATMFGYDAGLTNSQLESMSQGLVTTLGVFIAIATMISSKGVGLPAKNPE